MAHRLKNKDLDKAKNQFQKCPKSLTLNRDATYICDDLDQWFSTFKAWRPT